MFINTKQLIDNHTFNSFSDDQKIYTYKFLESFKNNDYNIEESIDGICITYTAMNERTMEMEMKSIGQLVNHYHTHISNTYDTYPEITICL